MTSWCIDLDGSAALRAELADHLRPDPRYAEPTARTFTTPPAAPAPRESNDA